jgi:CHAT domain-containing protein
LSHLSRPSARGILAPLLLSLLVVCSPASSADTPVEARVFDSALARQRDAETLKVLSAEGRLLYQRARVKLDGYRYCSMAVAQAERGELRDSIRSASMALHVGNAQGNEDLVALSQRDLAIAYSYAGDLEHAEQYAHQALGHQAKDPRIVEGPAYKTLGDVAVRRGRIAEAVQWYEKAASAASDRFRPLVQISLANAFVAGGDAARARALYDSILPTETDLQPLYRRGQGNLLLIEGKPQQARQAFEQAAREASGTDAAYHRLWAVEGIARSELALGNRAAARERFNEAAQLSEAIRARFRSEEFKTGLFGDMQKIFEQAILLAMEAGDVEGAWQLSERSRARALLDIVRGRVAPAGEAELSTGAVALQEVLGVLRQGEVLVQFHSLDDSLIAWIARPSGLQSVQLPLSRVAIDQHVEALRQSIFSRRRDTVELASALYDKLFAPLGVKAGERLVIVPHGGLHYLPFQALHGPDAYLIERNALAVVPSASLAVQLVRRSDSKSDRLIAFGNPANNAREQLPGAEREVERIGTLYANKRVYVEHSASKARFRDEAGNGRVLHVAAHAEVDSVDPLHSRILLAAEGDDSGFLEAREVYGVNLAGVSLVTLSACESGLGRIARGDEILGFTRSFLSAGASGLVASLWPVADDSTELLMTTFYSRLAGGAEAIDAMRDAQIAVLGQRRFAHPFFWAPFNLIGNWRLRAGA